MKLKTFDLSNSKTTISKEPIIRISRSAGLISFSSSVRDRLELSDTTKIIFVQDEDNPRDWFVKKTNDENAFPVRITDTGRVDLNSTHIVNRIFASIENGSKKYNAASFRLQTNPVELEGENYYLIITANPMNVADYKNPINN